MQRILHPDFSAETVRRSVSAPFYLFIFLQTFFASLPPVVVSLPLHAANWRVYDCNTTHKVFHIRHTRTRHIY